MTPKIGVSSPEFCSHPFEKVLEDVSKRFDHWEIVSEGEHQLPNVAVMFESLKDSYNLTYSIHAPFNDVNIASLNESFRETSVIELIKIMNIASELNVGTITFHPGMYSMVVPGLEKKSVENARRSLRTIERMSEDCGVRMCLENMPGFKFFLGQTPEELNYLLEGTNLPVCLDIGHAHTVNRLDEFIDSVKDRIGNVHIHDNNGSQDQHLTIGQGSVDFDKCLRGLSGYGGRYVIESKGMESAVTSKEVLTNLFSEI